MSRSDWLKLLIIAVFVCALVEWPYILAQWHPPTGYVFQGSFWAPGDLSQYLSAANQSAENSSWLIYDKLTPEGHSPAFIFPLYVLLGHFASQFHLPVEQVYRVLLVLSRLFLIFAIYWFVSAYLSTASWRRFGTLFLILSSGFGAWFGIAGSILNRQTSPADLNVVEMNTFLTLFSYPHLMLALGTLLVCARAWLLYLGNGRFIWLAVLGVGTLALGFLNPFSLPPLLLVLSVHAIVSWLSRYRHWSELAPGLGLTVAVSLPFLAYNYLTFSGGAFWGTVYGIQNELPTPNPLGLISAFGVIGMIAVLGLRLCLKRPSLERVFLVLAISIFCVLLYLPVPYQRRFGFGLHPFIACLALVAMEDVLSTFKIRIRTSDSSDMQGSIRPAVVVAGVALVGFLAIFTNSAFYLYINQMVTARIISHNPPPLFFESNGLTSARKWLTIEGDPRQIVLAHHRSGNFLAASIPGRVFTGHWTATVDFTEKNKAVEQFFSADTENSWRRQLLTDYNITHVVYGPWERQLGLFDPAYCDYLRQAYSSEGVSVFQVVPLALTAGEHGL